MRVVRSVAKDGNIYTSAFNLLHSQTLPAPSLHHTTHRLRHPQAIYSVSLDRVLKAFLAVLDEHDAVHGTFFPPDGQLQFEPAKLLQAQEELLEALLSHIDDCYQILKALYPPIPLPNPPVFANKWLVRAGHPTVKAFEQAIAKYRGETLAPIVNRVKHQHGRLRGVIFYGQRVRYPGYYVEGVDASDALGPDLMIHPDNTALSLNRDLRYHFVWLYLVDEHLRQAVAGVLRKKYGIPKLQVPRIEQVDPAVERIARRINELPMVFYPDEVKKPIPVVILRREAADMELEVIYPAPEVPFGPGALQIQATFAGDGLTRSWRLPYMAKQTP